MLGNRNGGINDLATDARHHTHLEYWRERAALLTLHTTQDAANLSGGIQFDLFVFSVPVLLLQFFQGLFIQS